MKINKIMTIGIIAVMVVVVGSGAILTDAAFNGQNQEEFGNDIKHNEMSKREKGMMLEQYKEAYKGKSVKRRMTKEELEAKLAEKDMTLEQYKEAYKGKSAKRGIRKEELEARLAKKDMTLEEYKEACKEKLAKRGLIENKLEAKLADKGMTKEEIQVRDAMDAIQATLAKDEDITERKLLEIVAETGMTKEIQIVLVAKGMTEKEIQGLTTKKIWQKKEYKEAWKDKFAKRGLTEEKLEAMLTEKGMTLEQYKEAWKDKLAEKGITLEGYKVSIKQWQSKTDAEKAEIKAMVLAEYQQLIGKK